MGIVPNHFDIVMSKLSWDLVVSYPYSSIFSKYGQLHTNNSAIYTVSIGRWWNHLSDVTAVILLRGLRIPSCRQAPHELFFNAFRIVGNNLA